MKRLTRPLKIGANLCPNYFVGSLIELLRTLSLVTQGTLCSVKRLSHMLDDPLRWNRMPWHTIPRLTSELADATPLIGGEPLPKIFPKFRVRIEARHLLGIHRPMPVVVVVSFKS